MSLFENEKIREKYRLIEINLDNQNVNYENKGQISILIFILLNLYKNPITEE